MNQAPARSRALFVVKFLGGNGITTHIMTLAEGLIAKGWEVAVVSANEPDDEPNGPRWFASRGISHFHASLPDTELSFQNAQSAFSAFADLHRVMRQFRPQVVHVHGLGVSPYAYVAARLHGAALVSTCHITPRRNAEKLAKRFAPVMRLASPLFGDRVIAISSEMQTVLRDLWRIPERRIRLILNGIDSTHFREPSAEERRTAREAFGLGEEDKAVCLIGRLYPTKGHDTLVKAVAQLRSEGLPVVALCAGRGPLKKKVAQLAASLGIADHVRLLGFVDARQVLWASDVFALPSHREGCPLVIAEAMVSGVVPVRTPAAGAFDQITDGVDGFITPFGDHEALAERLRELLQDDALYSKMSAAALQTAKDRFTARRMLADTEAAYFDAIREREVSLPSLTPEAPYAGDALPNPKNVQQRSRLIP
ncbi:MAG: glycosyltransferase family 4 protein [Rhodothermales bacterium]